MYFGFVYVMLLSSVHIICKHEIYTNGQIDRLTVSSSSSFHTEKMQWSGGTASLLDKVFQVSFPQQEWSVMLQIKCYRATLSIDHIIQQLAPSI